MYTAITRANFLLTYIDKVTFDDESTKATYKAEAKFVRALVYFHLVRKWGDVPLVTQPYLTNQSEINEHTFREKRETVYAQIIQDLKDGLGSNLVNIQPVFRKGKGCKAAINGLLGQVYLTMATTLSDGNKQSIWKMQKSTLQMPIICVHLVR